MEAFFLNEDETLNFELMINTVDEMIDKDVTDPIKELDKHRHRNRNIKLEHPELHAYNEVRDLLSGIED